MQCWSRDFMASVNGSWLHEGYIANAVPATTIGERVQDVPEVTASASLSYRHGITDTLSFIRRVDTNYVGSRIRYNRPSQLSAEL